jgi:hypothetical protein
MTKPDGNIRFCIDYRKLNKITKKDVYPFPKIDDTLEKMRGMEFYSSIVITGKLRCMKRAKTKLLSSVMLDYLSLMLCHLDAIHLPLFKGQWIK